MLSSSNSAYTVFCCSLLQDMEASTNNVDSCTIVFQRLRDEEAYAYFDIRITSNKR